MTTDIDEAQAEVIREEDELVERAAAAPLAPDDYYEIPPADFDDEEEGELVNSAPDLPPEHTTPIENYSDPSIRRQSTVPAGPSPYDNSEEVHKMTSSVVFSPFLLALSLWLEKPGTTRAQWQTLREVLQLLMDFTNMQQVRQVLIALPAKFDTLKRRCSHNVVAVKLRRAQVNVEVLKQPSMSRSKRIKLKASATKVAEKNWMYFVDPMDLIRRILKTDWLSKQIYQGPALLVEEPTELWHSFASASSARCASGTYAVNRLNEQIILGDIVEFQNEEDITRETFRLKAGQHFGRVRTTYLNCRKGSVTKDQLLTSVEPILPKASLTSTARAWTANLDVPLAKKEYLLHAGDFFISPQMISRRVDILELRYGFDGTVDTQGQQHEPHHIRYAVFGAAVRPISLCTPPVGELEVPRFGRQSLTDKFRAGKCFVLPFLHFIDAFGLYRNMYRSLLGFYLIFAGLSAHHRAQRRNVLTLGLGPHGVKFEDAVAVLQPALAALDSGMEMEIEGRKVFVSAFPQAYIGDMPQQADNAGLKRQNAMLPCSKCRIQKEDKSELDFDIYTNARSHYQDQIERGRASKMGKTVATKHLQQLGMKEQPSPLLGLCDAMDLILSRPYDPAHSELGGIVKMSMQMLNNYILTEKASQKFALELRAFPMPPGWTRLQSTYNHLDSYSLSELARLAVITPVLLRARLKDEHLKPMYRTAAVDMIASIPTDEQDGPDSWIYLSPTFFVARCFNYIAESTCLLMSRDMRAKAEDDLHIVVDNGRQAFLMLADIGIAAI